MTEQNAENSNQSNKLMQKADKTVGEIGLLINELTTKMSNISSAITETANLNKTIDGIAFQTNLLALNAAVEAARAGDAGAGFAVVADEVRTLAMSAAEAAKGSEATIAKITAAIDEGVIVVEKNTEAFAAIKETIKKTVTVANEISVATTEQSKGIKQISQAVSEQDIIVQQNAGETKIFEEATEEVSLQALELENMVTSLIAMLKSGNSGQTATNDTFQGESDQTCLPSSN